ncbi:hypothetical protein Acr_18g0000800 [Actinidia rufa]|uniref:Uncharacterized protein n=1 Tax=Actinidia rufa TaxID=165716 RepID=A0A7J0G545_9ERIC|nr:hypothetical protein Acr_18g0000800 [Actinidia rufa]
MKETQLKKSNVDLNTCRTELKAAQTELKNTKGGVPKIQDELMAAPVVVKKELELVKKRAAVADNKAAGLEILVKEAEGRVAKVTKEGDFGSAQAMAVEDFKKSSEFGEIISQTVAEAKKGPQFQELLAWIFDQAFEEFRKSAKEVYTDLDFSQFKYIYLEETTTGNVATEDEEEGGDDVESACSGMIVESGGLCPAFLEVKRQRAFDLQRFLGQQRLALLEVKTPRIVNLQCFLGQRSALPFLRSKDHGLSICYASWVRLYLKRSALPFLRSKDHRPTL